MEDLSFVTCNFERHPRPTGLLQRHYFILFFTKQQRDFMMHRCCNLSLFFLCARACNTANRHFDICYSCSCCIHKTTNEKNRKLKSRIWSELWIPLPLAPPCPFNFLIPIVSNPLLNNICSINATGAVKS